MIITSQKSNVKSQNFSSKFKRDIKERAYDFSIQLIRLADSLPKSISTEIVIKQLVRASTSVGANIVEAKSGSSRKDFTNFYTHALKSANETKYWLGLLKDACGYDNDKIKYLLSEINELSNILGASILSLKNRDKF